MTDFQTQITIDKVVFYDSPPDKISTALSVLKNAELGHPFDGHRLIAVDANSLSIEPPFTEVVQSKLDGANRVSEIHSIIFALLKDNRDQFGNARNIIPRFEVVYNFTEP